VLANVTSASSGTISRRVFNDGPRVWHLNRTLRTHQMACPLARLDYNPIKADLAMSYAISNVAACGE
jgi:hypothetical protein